MKLSDSSNFRLSLAPLGAGDLIDRSVRLYRRNFWTFLLIASLPVTVGTIFLAAWTILGSNLFSVNSDDQLEVVLYYLFVYLGESLTWIVHMIATTITVGGVSRNFIRHVLSDGELTFRETCKNIKKRMSGLIGMSTLIVILFAFFSLILFFSTNMVIVFGTSMIIFFTTGFEGFIAFSENGNIIYYLQVLLLIFFGLAVFFGGVWLFFLVMSRFVYVPQIMLVENLSAFAAVRRSTNLASKNVKRVAALFIFTLIALYSLIVLFYIPLGWYAWVNGINLFEFAEVPAWYTISGQVISQASLILLTPVWIIGICLLYVDERVRNEGYDIEIMASQRLGDVSSVSNSHKDFINSPQLSSSNNIIPKMKPRHPKKQNQNPSTISKREKS